jgi:MFS family permease
MRYHGQDIRTAGFTTMIVFGLSGIPGLLLGGVIGDAVMNVYYATVYLAIQDVIEPSLRGTAMSIYFFAMYVLGAALGPLGTGLASDFFTARAASLSGVVEITQKTLEPFRAQGLHSAMFIIPAQRMPRFRTLASTPRYK